MIGDPDWTVYEGSESVMVSFAGTKIEVIDTMAAAIRENAPGTDCATRTEPYIPITISATKPKTANTRVAELARPEPFPVPFIVLTI